MEQPYPDSLQINCPANSTDTTPITATAEFSKAGTQVDYSASVSAQAYGDEMERGSSGGLTNFSDIYASIISGTGPGTLAANGDEAVTGRILLHGKTATGLTISQDETHTFDDMNSSGATATATGGAAVSRTTGVLTIAAASNASGGATIAYSPARSLASYRYLSLPIMVSGSGAGTQALTFHAGGYTWAVSAPVGSSTATIDLCAPNEANAPDAWDTRWPLPTTTSPTSGPYNITTLTIDGVAAGATVQIGPMVFKRVNVPTVDLVPTLYPSIFTPGTESNPDQSVSPQWPVILEPGHSYGTGGNGFSQPYVRRGLLANSDGRQVVEETDFTYQENIPPSNDEGGGAIYYNFDAPDFQKTIAALADAINATDAGVVRWPGWSAGGTISAPAPFVPAYSGQPAPVAPYYNNAASLLASELYGGGALYTYHSDATDPWTFGWDQLTGAIPAQPLFDVVEMCGMEGDAFGHGGHSDPGPIANGDGTYTVPPLVLPAHVILRSGAHGLALTPDTHMAVVDAQFTLTQPTPYGDVSAGTSRAPDGWYHMSTSPYGRAGILGTVKSESYSIVLGTMYTRRRHRATLSGSPCCTSQMLIGDPAIFFPFMPQFSDPHTVPLEEWRRVAGGAGFGETAPQGSAVNQGATSQGEMGRSGDSEEVGTV